MADPALITRRRALVASLSGVLGTAFAFAPTPAKTAPVSRGDRLQKFLDEASATDRINWHAQRLCEALAEHWPDRGLWVANHAADDTSRYVGYVIHNEPDQRPGVLVNYVL